MRKISVLLIAGLMLAAPLASNAGNGSNAVVGSILGGATGAVIGNGFGGRDGAIVGGAIGAAAGVAIATDHSRNDGYRNDDYRYRNNGRYERHDAYDRDDRDDRYERGYGNRREVVVVESPRHYYRGNEFVYGVPSHYERDYDRYDDRGRNVVVIQQSPGYSRYEGNYYPPRRHW